MTQDQWPQVESRQREALIIDRTDKSRKPDERPSERDRGGNGALEGSIPWEAAAKDKEEVLKKELAGLRQSLEKIRAFRGATHRSPLPDTAPSLASEGASTPQPTVPTPLTIRSPSVARPVESPRPEEMPTASEPSPSPALSPIWSGRFHLVFTPCPGAEQLAGFWEVLDEVAGIGKVVDARPVSAGAEFEFILDLGNGIMELEELNRRIPHSQMTALGEDRLNVRWSPS